MSVRVRLAPSPTGPLHVGTARTALFNFLFAKGHGGTFVLRIEDTDRARSTAAYEQEIVDGLRWLGLVWEEGPDVGGPYAPYRQSERLDQYAAAIEQLLGEGKAYAEKGAIVLKTDVAGRFSFRDLVRGEVSFPATELADFVIAKPDLAGEAGPTPPSGLRGTGRGAGPTSLATGELRGAGKYLPLFHLAVVVDDAAMGITHVIRGEDHLSNTPKHILLQRALGLPTPQYAHLPLLLDAERRKLSKRTAEVGLLVYRDRGYLPEAVLNFLALLGWNPKITEEVFSIEDLVGRFDLGGIQKAGAVFDGRKLDWLQREHLRRLPNAILADRARPYLEVAGLRADSGLLGRALEVWRERGGTFSEVPESMHFAFAVPTLSLADIPWRGTGRAEAVASLEFTADLLGQIADRDWGSREQIHRALLAAVDQEGKDRGTVLWPLRYALTGRRESPGPGEVAWVLGKDETLRRVQRAREVLE